MTIDLSFNALYDARERIAVFPSLIRELNTTRQRIVPTPAHLDDIVQSWRASITAAASDFEERLSIASADPRLTDVNEVWATGAPVYFTRQLMEAKVAPLADRLCPGAKSGMRSTDRQHALRDIDVKIDNLRVEMETLRQALSAEQVNLRDQRQQAIWDKDTNARCDIESEQQQLSKDIENLRHLLTGITGHTAARFERN